MVRAIRLAWQGWGRVHPNPMVGALVLSRGAVVGEGWHGEFGGPHAEPLALEVAGERARGGTLVVTLEPCAHFGKQPPCVDAILRAGIRRCVIGAADPHPLAAGGADRLRAAGVEVEIGLESDAVRGQNAAFFGALRHPERPFVALKLATTLDGRIADATGASRWISGPAAREWVQWLRAGFEAIAVGGRTALVDDPSLTVRGPITPRVAPIRVVFDRRALIPAGARVVATAREVPTIVVVDARIDSARIMALEERGVEVIRADGLDDALARLRRRGISSLLVEGGGHLAGALMDAGLVDRFYWIQAPAWLGDDGAPAFRGVRGRPLAAIERWHVVERKPLGEDTLLVADRP